jgi:hypothetical protein
MRGALRKSGWTVGLDPERPFAVGHMNGRCGPDCGRSGTTANTAPTPKATGVIFARLSASGQLARRQAGVIALPSTKLTRSK